MKQPLPPSISAALAEVANIADNLAANLCHFSGDKVKDMCVSTCLDNLDSVASALTWKELEQAPAMLNSVARAYRQSFPCDSLGWEDAGRLQTIAYMIESAWIAAFEKANPDLLNDFNNKRENPLSSL